MKNKTTEEKIEAVLAKVRPYVQMHGGDVQLLGFKAGTATLAVSGTCVGCALADLTYNKMVGTLIKEKVPAVKEIMIEEMS